MTTPRERKEDNPQHVADQVDNAFKLTELPIPTTADIGHNGHTPPELLPFLTVEEVLNLPEPRWILHDILAEDSLAILYGTRSRWKTFLVMDWALHVSAGRNWQGHPTTQGFVVYIVAEGARGIKRRIKAWMRYHNVRELPNLRVIPVAVKLLQAGQTQRLINTIQQYLGDEKPLLVVIDTLARSMVGGNENATPDAQQLIDSADHVRQTFGCCVLVLHHSGHDLSRMRGNTVYPDASDTVICVKSIDNDGKHQPQPGEPVWIISEKAKDSGLFPPIPITTTLETWDDPLSVELVSSLVVVPYSVVVQANAINNAKMASVFSLFRELDQQRLGGEGLRFTEWRRAAAERLGVTPSSFSRYADELCKRGDVWNDVATKRYRLPKYAPAQ